MSIQEQIDKVWEWERIQQLSNVSAEMAKHDYETYVHKDTQYGSEWRNNCIRVAMIVKARLFEALCSPNEYIREWGKLIKEEKQRNGCL